MFSTFRRYLALVVATALALALTASAASANTVVITGGGAIAGTAGATQFRFNTVRRTVNCTSSTLRATSQPPGVYTTPLPFTFANLQFSFTTCTLTGGLTVTVDCTSTIARWQAIGLTAGGVTPNQITNNSCTVSQSATCSVRINGSVSGSYDNTANILTVFGSSSGQSLMAPGSTCSTLPNDPSITFSRSGGGNVDYAVAPVTTMTVT